MGSPKINWSKFTINPDYDAAPWWDFTKEGKLMVRSCDVCGHRWWPPGAIGCSSCGNFEKTSWVESSGKGAIYSFIVVTQPILGAFAEATPYLSAVIDLDDMRGVTGLPVRVMGVIDEGDDQAGINSKVELYWEKISADGKQMPRWRLSTQQPANVWKFEGRPKGS
ncbi:MAG: hypothetical protein EXR67_05120 [Dehalococcoidia bacterium]|nr:hypothetical protein [Dehalococcoidia bacterium]